MKHIKLTLCETHGSGFVSEDVILLNVDHVLMFKPLSGPFPAKSSAHFTYGETLCFKETFEQIEQLIGGEK